jgi:hypothetical protein
VLFTLQKFNSPALTGIVTALSILPGLLISPLAGALLDRHGRVRLIRLDYVVAMATMMLIAGLSIAGLLTPELLVVIAVVSSLTGPFSQTGMRSLFPLMVPEHLWERINAVDSNGYLIATIFGPPLAAAMFAIFGGDAAILAIAVPYGVAAVLTIGVREPNVFAATSGHLLRDAWDGLRYAWSNPTIRGLIFSISALNVAWGVTTIVIPLLVIQRLALPEWVVGIVYALSGAPLAGRQPSRRSRAIGRPGGDDRVAVPARPAGRTDGHRPVHHASAAHRSGLDRACLRRVDGVELRRLSDRCGHRRHARRGIARAGHRRGRGRVRGGRGLRDVLGAAQRAGRAAGDGGQPAVGSSTRPTNKSSPVTSSLIR